jgi:hypothetical protein
MPMLHNTDSVNHIIAVIDGAVARCECFLYDQILNMGILVTHFTYIT